eukprot:gene13465-biopygen15
MGAERRDNVRRRIEKTAGRSGAFEKWAQPGQVSARQGERVNIRMPGKDILYKDRDRLLCGIGIEQERPAFDQTDHCGRIDPGNVLRLIGSGCDETCQHFAFGQGSDPHNANMACHREIQRLQGIIMSP